MSTAGYLQDAKNQQKRLAETITAKGITATATEKYKDLVDKVAQIEELKGEEKILENFTNVLSEPKSIVQLEYPNDTPKTLNAKLGSKNLLTYPYTYTTREIKGVQWTVNADGTITATGTAAANSVFHINGISKEANLKLIPGTTYTISNGLSTAISGVSIVCNYYPKDATTYADWLNVATSRTGTFPNDGYSIVCYLLVLKDITVDNLTFKPQLELGSTATTYTPYISDFSTVNVIRCGKNILEYPYVETTLTRNGLTFTDNKDGTITVNGTATADTQFRLQDTVIYPNNFNPFNSIIGKQIYINGSPEGSSKDTYAIQWIQTGNLGNGTILEVQSTYYRFAILIKSGITVENLVFKPQIIVGSENTPYEPYQGQTYTPTATGEVTGITNLYPLTQLLTNNAGAVFEEVTGQTYKEILPSTDKNGITKIWQPAVEETVVCDYLYDETTKTLTLLL